MKCICYNKNFLAVQETKLAALHKNRLQLVKVFKPRVHTDCTYTNAGYIQHAVVYLAAIATDGEQLSLILATVNVTLTITGIADGSGVMIEKTVSPNIAIIEDIQDAL